MITEARDQIAAIVTAAGIDCQPYSPDAPSAPVAWVDSIQVDYSSGSGWSFCQSGGAVAQVISIGQRHDKAAALRSLEDLAPDVMSALEAVAGIKVRSLDSGTSQINGQDVPAVIFTIQFSLSK